ncbi:hypothetical protein AHF37_07977 [Paragonimus kellicotti]|nr:hypothetical protein AHF37_07977 [Paragonimus kellicotti]
MPSLPLSVTSVTQLQETDRKMLDPKFHSTMADYFRGISAPSAGALLRNMLERLMTRAVAAQITIQKEALISRAEVQYPTTKESIRWLNPIHAQSNFKDTVVTRPTAPSL